MKKVTARIAIVTACFLVFGFAPPEGPLQPIAFSHKQHAGDLKLACTTCHVSPEPGEMMTFPAESTCMTCHSTVKTDSEQIQKLAKFSDEKKVVPWVRVYQLPSFVFWSHKIHIDWGAKCADCHGEVATRERVFLEKPINMASCMDCHRTNKASIHCTFCHEQRN